MSNPSTPATAPATYAPTGRFIGKCAVCKRKFVADTEALKPRGCECRNGVACMDRYHGHEVGDTTDHAFSFIRWGALVAKQTATKCGTACTSAKSDKCACSCRGFGHGRGLA